MYHIKEDKRSQKSARLITEAVLALAERKPYEEITITDIEKKSTVARSTFYRLFDNTTDVLTYICDCAFAELTALHTQNKVNRINLTYLAGTYWGKHHKTLEIIIRAGYKHIFVESFTRHYPQFLSTHELDLPPVYEKNSNYAISIAASLFSTSLLTWIETGQQESIEELCQIVYDVLNQMIKIFTQPHE